MNLRTLTAGAVAILAGTASAQVTFEPLFDGFAGLDISSDGDAIAGNSTSDGIFETFRWTRTGGVVRLGRSTVDVFGTGAGTPNISNDGTRVSATIADATTSFTTVGLWEEGVGWTDCMPPVPADGGLLDNSYGSAWALSGDGLAVGGFYWRPSQPGGSAHAMNWTSAGGVQSLVVPNDDSSSRVNDINDDASVSVGWREDITGAWQPTAWRNGTQHTLTATDSFCEANGVNGSGDTVVGYTNIGPIINQSRVAAVWAWNGVGYDETVLGALPGTPVGGTGLVFAEAVSDDGDLVVGANYFVNNGPFSDTTGFMWTPRTGMFDVVDYMADNGITLPSNVQVSSMTSMTPDGSTLIVILQDTNTFDLATALLHIPVACSGADITTQGAGVGNTNYGMPDGLVSGADINFYVNAWLGGDLITGDVTTTGAGVGDPGYGVPDGQVTGADVQYYVNLWIAGCP